MCFRIHFMLIASLLGAHQPCNMPALVLSGTERVVLAPAGLYMVECRKLKGQITTAADAVVQQLLDVVCAATRESNLRVAEEYTVRSCRPLTTNVQHTLMLASTLPGCECIVYAGLCPKHQLTLSM